MRKITLFFSFFLEFYQILRTSRFQTSFHISRFKQSANEENDNKIVRELFVGSYEKLKKIGLYRQWMNKVIKNPVIKKDIYVLVLNFLSIL